MIFGIYVILAILFLSVKLIQLSYEDDFEDDFEDEELENQDTDRNC